MKRKTIGIILIVISVFNMITWIPRISNGQTEGALYYLIILVMFFLGYRFLVNSDVKTEMTSHYQEQIDLTSEKRNRQNLQPQIIRQTMSSKYNKLIDKIRLENTEIKVSQDTFRKLSLSSINTHHHLVFHIYDGPMDMVNITYETTKHESNQNVVLKLQFTSRQCIDEYDLTFQRIKEGIDKQNLRN